MRRSMTPSCTQEGDLVPSVPVAAPVTELFGDHWLRRSGLSPVRDQLPAWVLGVPLTAGAGQPKGVVRSGRVVAGRAVPRAPEWVQSKQAQLYPPRGAGN